MLAKMAEGGSWGSEKQLLGRFVQKQTKYGTATKLALKSDVCIKHMVTKSDTLMGIALKYGSTVEQLKRDNKLWTNDSLFLREFLLIPVAREDLQNIPTDWEIVEIDNTNRSRSNSQLSNSSQGQGQKCESELTNSVEKESPASCMDILSKYDSSIAQLKSNVQKLEKNAKFLKAVDGDNPLTVPPRKKGSHTPRRFSGPPTSLQETDEQEGDNSKFKRKTHSIDSSPVLVIKSRNNRHIQTSLERLEQANDDLYQL